MSVAMNRSHCDRSNMSGEELAWAQLFVVTATGLIVVWYTYETHIIRNETARQAAATPSAKLWDRQNDLDRLVFSQPSVAIAFMSLANHQGTFFGAPSTATTRDGLYCQLK